MPTALSTSSTNRTIQVLTIADFIASGELGPISLGMTQREVDSVFGSPLSWQNAQYQHPKATSHLGAHLWTWNSTMLVFDKSIPDRRLETIEINESWLRRPQAEYLGPLHLLCGENISKRTSVRSIRKVLDKAGIDFAFDSPHCDRDSTTILTENGVVIEFQHRLGFSRQRDKLKSIWITQDSLKWWAETTNLTNRTTPIWDDA